MGRWRDERGFTLVELMVVVLILGVLITIAMPTFLGARSRAQDSRAKQDVRIAYTAERAYYADTLSYTSSAAAMTSIEAALAYQPGATPAATGQVYLDYVPATNAIYLSAMSQSGVCWYLTEADGAHAGYASSPACGDASSQMYTQTW